MTTYPFNPDNIPQELTLLGQWVAWKAVPKKDGKIDKIPINAKTGQLAKSNEPATWTSFATAVKYYEAHAGNGIAGVGFVFSESDDFCGIDLDGIRDPETKELAPSAVALLERFNSYSEISPSQRGVKIFVKGHVPKGVNNLGVEMYSSGRFFTTTGQWLGDYSGNIAADRQNVVTALYDKIRPNDRTSGVNQGQRNTTAASISGTLLAQGYTKEQAEQVMTVINQRNDPPMSKGEVNKVIASIDRAEKSKPVEPVPDIEIITLKEIRQLNIIFPPPIIGGLLKAGDNLLVTGKSGIGKSLIADNIAFAVASGTMLFGQFDIPEARKVLIIQSENSLEATQERLKALIAANPEFEGADSRIFTTMVNGDCRLSGDFSNPEFIKAISDMLQAVDPGLLIIDPLVSFHRSNENDNVGMRTVLDNLTSVIGGRNMGIVLTHHHGKGDYTGQEQARGATAIVDWARGILTLNQQNQGQGSTLLVQCDHTKHSNFRKSKSLLLEIDGPLVEVTEPDVLCPPSLVAETLQDAGGKIIGKNQFIQVLIETHEVSRKTAADAIERAEKFGNIKRIKCKKGQAFGYELPDSEN